MLKPLVKKGISLETYDMNILAAAVYCDTHLYPDNVMFLTNDLSLQNIANLFLGEDSIDGVKSDSLLDSYNGYLSVSLTEEEMAYFY